MGEGKEGEGDDGEEDEDKEEESGGDEEDPDRNFALSMSLRDLGQTFPEFQDTLDEDFVSLCYIYIYISFFKIFSNFLFSFSYLQSS